MSIIIPPPHDTIAEAGAIACVLTAPDGADLLKRLRESDFYDLRHRVIYQTLTRLHADGRPIDIVSLDQRLRDEVNLERAGRAAYVAALPDQSPSHANFPTFLETLRDRAERRKILRDCDDTQRRALDTSVPVESHGEATIEQILLEREFNANVEPREFQAVYSLAGVPISTPGNLTTITAGVKVGKSAAVGAMVAAAMPHETRSDLLGFESKNMDEKALVWIDSEQSPYDFWHGVKRAIKRAGLESPPPWLRAHCLTGLSAKRGWEAVCKAIDISANRHRGIHSILLDGAADFVSDVNDAEESNAFVALLHELAIKYDCPIIGVIHFNPGSDKIRGHLGSQLERKAETNLALEKDTEETTVIYSAKNRRASIAKATGPRFRFDPTKGMHISVESARVSKDNQERSGLVALAEDIFNGHPSMRFCDLQVTVKNKLTVSDKTAERKVTRMTELGVIKKSVAGLYVVNSGITA